MFNIKFKGKYADESQLKKDELPIYAVKFKEPDSILKAFLLGGLVSLPVLFVSTILLIFKVGNFMRLPFYQFILIILLDFILLYIHELIYALSLPIYIEKEIWSKMNEGALFVYFNKPITKLRFIWVCFAPNLILGYIPFVLFILGFFDFNNILCNIIGVVSWAMIISGVGDYLNIYNTIIQVPKDAKVLNYGLNSYWFK